METDIWMLQSDRLVFRKITSEDFEEVAATLRDPKVEEIWEQHFSDQDVEEWIQKRQRGYRENGIDYLLAVERETGKTVGQIGLLRTQLEGEWVWDVGYLLKTEACGRGYATEGARRMIAYAFQELDAQKVCCDIRPVNHASLAVAKRLGMVRTGSYLKKYRGLEREHLIFEITRQK